MGFMNTTQRRFGIAGELLNFFWSNKRWWMLPVIAIVLVFGVLLILASNPAVAPFIYTLF